MIFVKLYLYFNKLRYIVKIDSSRLSARGRPQVDLRIASITAGMECSLSGAMM
jgi:hypothetical protein